MNTYAVFCKQANGRGTTWIGSVEANSSEEAAEMGRLECANDWGYDKATIHVLGVARGNIDLLFWEDTDE